MTVQATNYDGTQSYNLVEEEEFSKKTGVGRIIAMGSVTCFYQDTNFLAGIINMSGFSLQTNTHKVFLEIRHVMGSAMDLIVEKKYTLNTNSIKVELRGNGGFTSGQLCEVAYIVVEKVG